MTAYHVPTAEEIAALEQRAHELRAAAIRKSFAAAVQFFGSLPHSIAQLFSSKSAA